MRKQRTPINFVVSHALDFACLDSKYLYFLNTNSSQALYPSPIAEAWFVSDLVQNPHCWFSHASLAGLICITK